MSLPIPVANALRADLLWTDSEDSNALTRLHFAYAGTPPSAADCINIASGIEASLIARIREYWAPSVQCRGVDVIDLSADDAHSGVYLSTTAGTRGGAILPAGACVLVNSHIARRYRGGKPRSYLPLLIAGDLADAQTWVEATRAALEAAWATFVADIALVTAGGTEVGGPISISYYQGYLPGRPRSNGHLMYAPAPRAVPKVDPILSQTVNRKPGSQRRRNLH